MNKVVISCNYSKNIISTLNKFNIKTVKTLENENLCKGLSGHADLQINIIDDIAIVADFAYNYYKENLTEFNVIKGISAVQATYPNDIAYNVSVVGKTMYHNLKYTDSKLIEIYKSKGFRIQNVKQGYTKCTTCIVNENAVITEDFGIAKALLKNGVDVLTVDCGDVLLDGFDYGFLGGASGLVAKNTLAFCGEIKNHRNYKEIYNFTQKHKVDIISLCNQQLTDIGSIIPAQI